MTYYAGLDVSLKEVSICVVDETGAVRVRGVVACEPEAVVRFFAEKQIAPALTVHESGQLSIWLQRSLSELGLTVSCVDARVAHKVLSARLNKSDAADAEGLAQLARTGWFTSVHIRSLDADRLRTLIGARDRLLRLRNDLERHIRGVLKTFGIRLTGLNQGKLRQAFRDQLAEAARREPVFGAIAEGFIPVHASLCAATAAIDKDLRDLAKGSELVRRLMTVPGVGPIVALNFIAVVDRAERFRNSGSIGAFLGLTPRRYQSGETDYSGRISKCGDVALRSLLFEAATSLMCRVKRFSPLKSWALRLAGRKGFKRAAVATARKIAVVMLTLWKTGAEFRWTKEAVA